MCASHHTTRVRACVRSDPSRGARQVENMFESTKTVTITINFTKNAIVTNTTTPLVLVHRIQMPILERMGASYELMLDTSKNIKEEIEKMDKGEMPSKVVDVPKARRNEMYSPDMSVSSPPATASSSKRPMESDELASLRATVGHLSKAMNEMLEREAKRQAVASQPPPPPYPPSFYQPFYQP